MAKTKPLPGIQQATHDVLRYKVAGMSTQDIANITGLPHAPVQQLIIDAIAKVTTEVDELAIHEYALASLRIDALIQAVWPQAISGDVKAIEAAAKLLDRRAKMTGSDRERQAPTSTNANGYTINITPVTLP